MEENHICASICDQLPTLSANHPWLVDRNFEEEAGQDNRDYIIYTTHNPLSKRRFQIPSLLGRRIRGCFHGWVVLSNHPHNDMWSLWNPVTSNIIRLPCLISKFVGSCCLSSHPGDHGSIFMLTSKKHTIVYCRMDCNRNKLKWVEMSYLKQVKSIVGRDVFLRSLTCCDGKVYGLIREGSNYLVLLIDIVIKGREIVISLLRYTQLPCNSLNDCMSSICLLKGCCTELFFVGLGFREVGHVTEKTVGGVCVYKLDMTNMRWEEMEDLEDASFFLDLSYGYSVYYSPAAAAAISSQLAGGGYVHFLDKSGKVISSYDYKNKTIALSSMPTSHTSLVEQGKNERNEDNENEMVVKVDDENTVVESRLLNIPFDVLKMISEFCVGVEYLNFRAACKQCHLAAPNVRWSKGGRLQQTSYSPWLMVLHKDGGVISFTDPVFGDSYFIKTPQELLYGDLEIHCCMYGWVLLRRRFGALMFYNPFTSDIRELPYTPYLDSYWFSAPPTSSDCMVVGFTRHLEWHVYVHFVAREPSWRRFRLYFGRGGGGGLHFFHFATPYRQNLYALYNNGALDFIETHNNNNNNNIYSRYSWRKVLAEGPRSSCGSVKQNFLMKHDQQLVLVVVGEFGEPVEVFKLNDSTEWETMESLGRHVIYIGGTTCLCVEAKTAATANKIYFPRVHSEKKKLIFYSLETRRYHYHTSNVEEEEEESFGDFMGTTHHIDPHLWIEPTWS